MEAGTLTTAPTARPLAGAASSAPSGCWRSRATIGSSTRSGAGTRLPSRLRSSATAPASSPSAATCSAPARRPRTPCSTPSRRHTRIFSGARGGRSRSRRGSTRSLAIAACPCCARAASTPSELHELPTDGLSEQVEQRAELRELLADVRELPEEQRAALLLAEAAGLSHAEVAEVLGCEAGSVKGLVFRARTALIERRDARDDSVRGDSRAARHPARRRAPPQRASPSPAQLPGLQRVPRRGPAAARAARRGAAGRARASASSRACWAPRASRGAPPWAARQRAASRSARRRWPRWRSSACSPAAASSRARWRSSRPPNRTPPRWRRRAARRRAWPSAPTPRTRLCRDAGRARRGDQLRAQPRAARRGAPFGPRHGPCLRGLEAAAGQARRHATRPAAGGSVRRSRPAASSEPRPSVHAAGPPGAVRRPGRRRPASRSRKPSPHRASARRPSRSESPTPVSRRRARSFRRRSFRPRPRPRGRLPVRSSRRADVAGSVPRVPSIDKLEIADDPAAWRAAGFEVDGRPLQGGTDAAPPQRTWSAARDRRLGARRRASRRLSPRRTRTAPSRSITS